MGKYKQGEYNVINKDKYLGNKPPIFRSGWEEKFMIMLDLSPNIMKWGSEYVIIHYWDKASNKPRRYFTDFYIELENGRKIVIEIKPEKEIQKPSEFIKKNGKIVPRPLKTQKQKLQYLNEMKTYITNRSKWEAATKYCDINGIEFKIATETNFKLF